MATRRFFTFVLAAAALWGFALGAQAATYEVEVTNITKGQTFTPLLVVSHKASISLFEVGQPASDELALIAEAGDIGPLDALLGTIPNLVHDTSTNGGLLEPGQSTKIYVEAQGAFRRISLVGMLIPTNDTFVALNSAPIGGPRERTHYVPGYDAGSEYNDQNCDNMPGPRCGGEGYSEPADDDEGFIYIGNGFHDLSDRRGEGGEILGPFTYDWNNPVARVTIRKAPAGGDDDDSSDDDSSDD